jgi:hypothetical protein
MKKSFFLVGLATFALASCSNEDTVSNETDSLNAIGFGTYVQKATKATPVTGTIFPTDGDFLVLGYSTGTADLAVGDVLNFMRQTVTYDGTSYNYSPIKYWPVLSGAKASFFAVSPADISTVTPASLTTAGLPAISYAVPTDAVKQEDLMLASSVNKTKADGTVAFAFTHALTKIGVTAKLGADYGTSGTYIRITSISLKNVAGTADFTTAADGTWSLTAPTVFTSDFTLDYLKNLVDNGSVSTTTAKTMVLDNSYLMMVPFDYSASATAALEVVYTITYTDGTSSSNTSTTLLKDMAVASGYTWVAGSAVSYNLTFTLNAVSFSASMTDWSTATDVAL